MHYPLIVISDQKPTHEHLSELLEPFAQEFVKDDEHGDYWTPGKFDSWALGGRYRGWLNVIDRTKALFAGEDDITDSDKMMDGLAALMPKGMAFMKKGGVTTYSGYDAAQVNNVVPGLPRMPRAVLADGEWHEINLSVNARVLSMYQSMISSGLHLNPPHFSPEEIADIEHADTEWEHRFADLMEAARDDQWIAVIDCHE